MRGDRKAKMFREKCVSRREAQSDGLFVAVEQTNCEIFRPKDGICPPDQDI